MNLFNLLRVFAVALLCLFSLQAFWLYHTYQIHLEKIKESVNSIFYQTIEKELDQRFLELGQKATGKIPNVAIRTDTFKINYGDLKSDIEGKSIVSQQFAMTQQLVEAHGIHFNPVKVDSIFRSLLQSNQYHFQYRINFVDPTGRILNTAGTSQISGKGFKTIVLPIIDGEKTYAFVEIPSPVVFKNMAAILIVSILIIFFIIACLIFVIKLFLDQNYLYRLRENFINALTHDMTTPLATIHSVLDRMEKGTIDNRSDPGRKFNAIAIEQVVNLQTTVNQILTLAYIDKKQLSLNKQTVDLQAMVRSLIDNYTVKSNKAIEFQTFFDLHDRNVYADPYYLNNAISNLIDNAIKYSGDSVKIEIECTAGEKQICIRVKDAGFGISSNDQLKIFKPFERGAEIKRNRINGFGIGLNYVQQVIEAHEGKVTVSSREGIGSEFILTFPAC